ncbi:transposase [Acuticoccus sp.]|uniref:transposase n=1 Tax=Acuticoccus sp. TaxID=1904378 RepID=UPI003B51A451
MGCWSTAPKRRPLGGWPLRRRPHKGLTGLVASSRVGATCWGSVLANEFWASDRPWAAIEPHSPTNPPGARRVHDRPVISGIIHVLKSGCRWKDLPAVHGPCTTVNNRRHRWSQRRS